MKDKKEDDGWFLKEIKIRFEPGFSLEKEEEKKHDRYIGKIEFRNKHSESFNLNIPVNMATKYLELMKEDIIATAEALGSKIANSIRNSNDI